jgi:hypothetical protein
MSVVSIFVRTQTFHVVAGRVMTGEKPFDTDPDLRRLLEVCVLRPRSIWRWPEVEHNWFYIAARRPASSRFHAAHIGRPPNGAGIAASKPGSRGRRRRPDGPARVTAGAGCR